VYTRPDNEEFVQLSATEVKSLIDEYLAGNSAAVEILFEMARPVIYNAISQRKIPPNVDHGDIASELNLVILDNLSSYKPELASFVTFIYHIIHRRINRIIMTLSGSRSFDSGKVYQQQLPLLPEGFDVVDSSSEGVGLWEQEILGDVAEMLHTLLTPYERQIYLDYLQSVPTTKIAEMANEYLDSLNEHHKKISNVDVNKTITKCTEKIKEELRQRGVLDSVNGELQKVLF